MECILVVNLSRYSKYSNSKCYANLDYKVFHRYTICLKMQTKSIFTRKLKGTTKDFRLSSRISKEMLWILCLKHQSCLDRI